MAPGDDSMKSVPKRQLGSTGIDVSCLGLGTVKLGRNQGVKYPRHFDLPNDEQVIALLDQARGLGINFIDTAPAYGSSEERLGKLMQNRQDWIICSKVGEEFKDGASHFDFSAQHTRHSVERSLRRLRTDYLDLVLIHSNGEDLGILEQTDCLETLLNLKDEGLIRAVGMSTKTAIGGKRALPLCDALMLTFNATTTAEEPVIDLARAQGKAILVKKAFDSGHATDQPGGPEQALGFVLTKPGVSSVIVGTINPEHLRSNAEIAAEVILN
jgi:aryl-alcohol dehydrogenase-like predicted oxidoreductase